MPAITSSSISNDGWCARAGQRWPSSSACHRSTWPGSRRACRASERLGPLARAIELNSKAAIVHVDCDLYQSTVDVLWGLHRMDALQDGTVFLFDDWNCNRGNPNYGERRAWGEFLEGQDRYSSTPWYTYGYNGAAFILHDRRA